MHLFGSENMFPQIASETESARVTKKNNVYTVKFSKNDVGTIGYSHTREFTYILFIISIRDINVSSKTYPTHNKNFRP